MDNFEGGSPMTSHTLNQTQSVTMNHTPAVRSEEVILSHETETHIPQPDIDSTPEIRHSDREVADKLLADTKEIGIAEVFKKLSTGGYRQAPEDTVELVADDDHESFEDEEYLDVHNEFDSESPEQPEAPDTLFESRKREVVSYVSKQVEADPLMKQMLGEVASEMIEKEEPIDPEVLQDEALSRYIAKKEEGEPQSLEGKVASIEEQFADLLQENEELRKELSEFKELVKQQSETMRAMALALLEMTKKLHKEQEDEKEKMTLLELLIQLMGMLLQEMTKVDEKGDQYSNHKIDISKIALLSPKHQSKGKENINKPLHNT